MLEGRPTASTAVMRLRIFMGDGAVLLLRNGPMAPVLAGRLMAFRSTAVPRGLRPLVLLSNN